MVILYGSVLSLFETLAVEFINLQQKVREGGDMHILAKLLEIEVHVVQPHGERLATNALNFNTMCLWCSSLRSATSLTNSLFSS